MQKGIAFFDFDGTITRKDTMLELAKYKAGKFNYYTGMLRLSPFLMAMKAGLLSAQRAKELFLKTFFGQMPIADFNQLCQSFCRQQLPQLLRPDALQCIAKHQAEGNIIVVVTASAQNWVAPWCTQNNLVLIATILQEKDGCITGKLAGNNCNGKEKVGRINKQFILADYNPIYAYGDSAGDKPMLALAQHSHFKFFVQ